MAGRVKKSGRGRPQIASLTPAKYFDSASARFAGFDVAPNPALTLQILCRCFALVRDVLVFDDLPLIETAETGALDCRDVDKDIFAAALRLNESIPFLRIEPRHGAFRHLSLLPWSIAAADITRKAGPDRARMIETCNPVLIIWYRCAFWDNGVDEQPSAAVYR